MSRSGLFIFENEPIWLIHDSSSLFFFNRFVRKVSATRDTRFGIGRTVPVTRDTRVRLVVLVYCQARATPNDRLRPNAATNVDYRVGLYRNPFTSLQYVANKSRGDITKYACKGDLHLRHQIQSDIRQHLIHLAIRNNLQNNTMLYYRPTTCIGDALHSTINWRITRRSQKD
jgi:hypothetical protein